MARKSLTCGRHTVADSSQRSTKDGAKPALQIRMVREKLRLRLAETRLSTSSSASDSVDPIFDHFVAFSFDSCLSWSVNVEEVGFDRLS